MTTPRMKAPKRSRRAWATWRSRPLPRMAVISDEPPTAQITMYRDDTCVLTRRDTGGIWRSYPIDPAALVHALSALPITSGLLPTGTIATGIVGGAPYFVLGIAPRVTPIQIDEGGTPKVYQVPLPTLIWAGCATDYRVFALRDPVITVASPLLVPPLPNTYSNGGICWGTTSARSAATATTIRLMLKLFLEESAFNTHLAGGKSTRHATSVLPLLRALAKDHTPAYPVDDLVPTHMTVGDLVGGRIWGARP